MVSPLSVVESSLELVWSEVSWVSLFQCSCGCSIHKLLLLNNHLQLREVLCLQLRDSTQNKTTSSVCSWSLSCGDLVLPCVPHIFFGLSYKHEWL